MNTRKLKHFIHCAVVLLGLGIVLGMVGCSKKAIKTAASDAIAADTEPAPVEVASSGDGLMNAGSSGRVAEALGTVIESRGIVGDKGKIGELEIKITDSDLDDISARSEGRPVEIVADELELGIEAPRRAVSRVGEEFIVVQPGTAEGAQTSSGTLSFLEAGQPVPGGSGFADERIFVEGASSGTAAPHTGGTLSFLEAGQPVPDGSELGDEMIVIQGGSLRTAPLTASGVSSLKAGQSVPGGSESADERIFIEGTSPGTAAPYTGGMLAFTAPAGAVSQGQGAGGEMIIIESARAGDTHAAIGSGEVLIEGERQGQARPGTKESTATFLVEKRPTGNIVNFSDAPERDAPGSAKGARVSSAGKGEAIVITPRPKDEDPSPPKREEARGSQPHVFGDTRHADSDAGPEHVPEPLIVAEALPELPISWPARETKPQAPSVASAATDTFMVKADFEDIYFDFDQWAIPKPMQTRLSEHAQWLKANPGSDVFIEGHCDVRGSREYNMVLGEKRARSVKDFLLDLGVKEDQLSMISYGKERLTCFKNQETCHQDNRRAHLLLR